ncbi:MAG: S26 family signal peptidase [Bacteroidaceae bacterium]|nr:S26 family signal peptidase [Bacteroidaceae bacterium]
MKGKRFILCLLVLLAVTLLVRVSVCRMLTIPHDGEAPTLVRGDRVLVNLWSYGLRRPCSRWGGYRRYATRMPKRGDWMVFNSPAIEGGALPDTSSLCIGCILACPGDTIWMGPRGHISATRHYGLGCIWPIVVPARGTRVHITPWNRPLYALTASRFVAQDALPAFEQLGEEEIFRSDRDYFWLISGNEANLNDSRSLGLVPMEHVVGKAVSIVYSFDPSRPWWKAWRRARTFRPVGSTR